MATFLAHLLEHHREMAAFSLPLFEKFLLRPAFVKQFLQSLIRDFETPIKIFDAF
jgi:hypothetical protein